MSNIACKPCPHHSREAITVSSSSSNRSAKPQSQPCLEQDREAMDPRYDPDDIVISFTSVPLSTPPAANTIVGDLNVEDPMAAVAIIASSYFNVVKTFS
ncbi:hypothetical protein ACFX2A_042982 [Malus domestica]